MGGRLGVPQEERRAQRDVLAITTHGCVALVGWGDAV